MKEYTTNNEMKVYVPDENQTEQELAYKRFISVLTEIIIRHSSDIDNDDKEVA